MDTELPNHTEAIKSQIAKISLSMEPQPDSEGILIPSFQEWVFSLQLKQNLMDLLLQNEAILKVLKKIYHFAIYNKPKPSKEPIQEYLTLLETKLSSLAEQRENFEKGRIEGLIPHSKNTYIGTDGQFYSAEIFNKIATQLNQEKKILSEILI